MSSAKFDIVVYGATGFTGQLVAEYLAAHYKDDKALKWAMAGRSLDKLKSVREAIGAPADTPLIVADASDAASLKAMVAQTKSVITTVGPYQIYGEELLAACVAGGTDYFDLCGEPVWMRQMIDKYEAAAKASGARIVFSCGYDSVPFELGTFFVQEEAKRVFGAAAARVKGRVRDMRGTLSGGTAASAKATFDAVAKDLSLVAILNDHFALTPGFAGPKQPKGNKAAFEEDLQSWAAPFMMALINTRNVHRSNMLMGFPYGQEFVYDEMVLTGPGEKGEANAKRVMAVNAEKTGPKAPKPGEGPSKEERENGLFNLLYVAIAPDGRMVRAGVTGDRDPGYGSTSKMISECAICMLRDTPDVAAGFWTPGAAMQHRLIKRLQDHAGLTFEVEG
ncbi:MULTISPECIES: saccharopine dehydrogenase family protein [Bradyrhizobium]|uniref:Bll4978 protein n=1 Tax=Bradyrhizobium diazoefficiens (strain JCM 10833 / BCRC 13528 / IAM 13628 / NBRC 14792 / USDA 110) TaxID=224911 RepID=Q89KC9_BRADU|nr:MULTISPECIES: saccharopine dehydrogenase NADP-binding domain-containing protein [Bradyrhizobium]AND90207.1 saccharopine dehydrogenase [Bradyrhizobium diazoefficiens USDA 110]PDT59569.1 saccharopine dehydrogenase [Bradyrhizobium diazoefficiens]QBP23761.1 saccharopine dehydrogenase [Bradyrhizobium diazoefficiens]QHP70052.1 saccharopine dehydrogenase [Bradyrhizobium sp. LCT2]QLD43221.1 saccharopine dehydrogenase NADP-binding domain-containing protein [Bradyrhizobium diazoefficiens]